MIKIDFGSIYRIAKKVNTQKKIPITVYFFGDLV